MSLNSPEPGFREAINFALGYWEVLATDLAITGIRYSAEAPPSSRPNPLTTKAISQLSEYFAKRRTSFELDLDISAYSSFQQQVWNVVREIEFGKTKTYSQLAHELSNPLSVRAVGTANGRNPFPLVIPCHRVIGKDNKLTGYAYGLELKEWLLVHEGAIQKQPTLFG